MTLLDDLRALDLSAIAGARANISVSVNGEGVQAVVDGGAVASALGDVGAMVTRLTEALEHPDALFAPLAAALASVAGDLDAAVGDLPLDDYLRAVTDGVAIVTRLLDGIGDDPLAVLRLAGRSLPDLLGELPARVEESVGGGVEALASFASLVARLDGGLPADVDGLLDLALEVLLPFPRQPLDALRLRVDALLSATASLALPDTRTQGLVARLDAVAAAAVTGDAAAVTRAVADLERLRAQTVDVIRADLAVVVAAIDRLPVTDLAEAVEAAHLAVTGMRDGVLDTLDAWRAQVAALRVAVEGADATVLVRIIEGLTERVEAFLRTQVAAGIDARVDRLVAWVRATFGTLPVRALRAEVTAAIHAAADVVAGAGLDEPIRAVRGVVADVADALTGADLADRVHAALAGVLDVVDAAVSGVVTALEAVAGAVGEVKDQAEAVLLPAADVVRAFGTALAEVRASVDALDVEAAAHQVIARVHEIRSAVEGIVANVPLPEPLRPVVEGVIAQLDALHLDAVRLEDVPCLAPILDVAKEFDVGSGLGATLDEGLAAVRAAVESLVPAQLVASIDAEVKAALDTIKGFDPSTLLTGVSAVVDDAASAVEGVDLTAAVEPARVPFLAVLDAWDRVRPSVLLDPAARAYDEVISGLRIPGGEELVRGVAATLDATGNAIGAAVVTPLTRLAPEGTSVPPAPAAGSGGARGGTPPGSTPPGGAAAPGAGAAPVPAAPPVDATLGIAGGATAVTTTPGDVVRLLGYLPAKLRGALADLDEAVLAGLLGSVDRVTAGLARDVRAAATAVARAEAALDTALDTMFAPLGQAQARAQLAVQARFGAGGLDLDATFGGIALCGSAAMRVSVSGGAGAANARIRAASARHASVATEMFELADALARCSLSGLVGDADAFLAALDPEPLAAEVDELARAVVRRTPVLVGQVAADLQAAMTRLRAVLLELNPGAQAAKFEVVLHAVLDELDVLDPRKLGAELDEVHAAVRATLAAYDPAVVAADLEALLATAAAQLRALDPAALLGDLSPFDDVVAAAEAANPATALAALSGEMSALVDAFAGIDVDGVLAGVAELPQQVVDAFVAVLDGIRVEVRGLLESLRYATGQASVSVSAEVHT